MSILTALVLALALMSTAVGNPYPRFSPAWWAWEQECGQGHVVPNEGSGGCWEEGMTSTSPTPLPTTTPPPDDIGSETTERNFRAHRSSGSRPMLDLIGYCGLLTLALYGGL
ncbi:hypothetical protein FOL47_000089 [Perkinsus chesapeaki]|uniref:Uncharacterized protein n=1 Tax=Perkinsus chesapeaki TaxID=330153 RepID=A0A7J6N357_PERCH|nr:hypothetical protein FOL47_000089 [Perkinsus chesapeaki]